jgi:cob(I)alamin adenosyltransferase
MHVPDRCEEIREKWRRARALLHHIEMDKLATEEYLKVNPQKYLREHHEWLERMQEIVEGEMKELERALMTCLENQER